MTPYTNLDSFFYAGVSTLSNDHYTTNNKQCDICQEADAPPTAANSSTPSASIVKIKSCAHIYHKHCLQTWIMSRRSKLRDATCPMCRAPLVTAPQPSQEIDRLASELRERHQLLATLLNDLLPTTVDEAYEYAQEVVALAATVDERMGVNVVSESVSGMSAYVDEYETLQAAGQTGLKAWMRKTWRELQRLCRGKLAG
jgi:hypothetical protein